MKESAVSITKVTKGDEDIFEVARQKATKQQRFITWLLMRATRRRQDVQT